MRVDMIQYDDEKKPDSGAASLRITQKRKGLLAAELLLRNIPAMYAPGGKLPPERALAQEMGISRNTLREAMAALSLAGLLELRPCSGNFVLEHPDIEQAGKMLERIFSSRVDLFVVLDARIAFEPGIARLACEVAVDEEIGVIASRLASLTDALEQGDSTAYSGADKEFHLAIARATHNSLILNSLQPLIESLHTPLWNAMKSDINVWRLNQGRLEEHKAIFAALENREANAAEAAMRRHLHNSRLRLAGEETV